MKRRIFLALFVHAAFLSGAQDTFSILAFDSVTREVGGAGASCVDLNQTPYHDHFIIELFSDTGAVATQAQYFPFSQAAARTRMRAGDSPAQMMAWLSANVSNPQFKQWGAVKFGETSAAFTGTACTDYKNHIVGPNYTIHGNILLGQEILDSMESRFLRQEGDLACKLMAAMQGAKKPGADSRCMGNNSSTLFAFLKVSLPADTFGKPSFLVSMRSAYGDSIEPIDSLQKLFSLAHVPCPYPVIASVKGPAAGEFRFFPNPARTQVQVTGTAEGQIQFRLTDAMGRLYIDREIELPATVGTGELGGGTYYMELLRDGKTVQRATLLKQGP